ncbi:MAG TPA: protein-glutamate O-methyltransferase CheR, partial [Polyangiaceae bacterium]
MTRAVDPVGPDQVERLRAIVARRLGLAFDETKTSMLEELLERRARRVDQSVDGFLAALEGGASRQLRELVPELTVGETYFFRNSDQLRAFAETVLPERMRARGADRRLRVLSAGCASGEEAYSLSILLHEHLKEPSWEASVLAVDANPAALERAARARFSAWALRETPPDVERRWFKADGRELVLIDAARTRVTFAERNLAEEDAQLWAPATYDVVFCRNVLMYFTPESARRVVERIERSLVPGGYLFLGHAETLRGLSGDFHLCHTHGTFYYRRRDGLEGQVTPPSPSTNGAPDPPPTADGASWAERIRSASDRIETLTAPRRPSTPVPSAAPAPRPDLGP